MKELLQQYAAYNLWATGLLVDIINKLPGDDKTKEVAGSFPSLYTTLQHMWLAEEVWWQRLKLAEHIVLQSETFAGSFEELTANHAKQSELFAEWIQGATESQLDHVFAYIRNKEQIKMPVYQMLHHVFNHATYHRGQLVAMLRQLGITKIPSTDFSTFCMKK
ncbi:MAG: DinB family protein [Chitinophagaceae bacterium]|nr:DinB family protein [Chitinophagaceae bacterium]